MSVSELVRREPPANTGSECGVVQLLADERRSARAAACRSADDAEQPSDRQAFAYRQPWFEV
jgi:hypothetical protein